MNIYDFTYSVALIRTLETHLLSENEVERMTQAKDANEAFKILNESDYADNKAGVEDPADFQKVLNEGLLEIRTLMEKITPDKNILNILWFWYDFHNIKTLLKAKLGGIAFEEIKHLLNEMGSIPHDALKTFIFENKEVDFKLEDKKTETYIKEKIQKIQKIFENEGKNPQVIDLYMDQKLMKLTYKLAQDSKIEFLIEYVKKLIDLTNIKLFFRMKAEDKDQDLFHLAFIRNGSDLESLFTVAYKKPLSEFPEIMKSSPYAKIIAEGYKHFEAEKTFIFLEKEIENYLTEYFRQAKYTPFGPDPLIGYFTAKKNNALIMRMILINKMNKVNPEEIKLRLRNLYK